MHLLSTSAQLSLPDINGCGEGINVKVLSLSIYGNLTHESMQKWYALCHSVSGKKDTIVIYN